MKCTKCGQEMYSVNKDEMINNIATSIGLACTSIELDLKDRQEIANTLCALGCRKVEDDEIIVKKRQYEQLKKYNRDRKRLRLRWQQAKQETREILQRFYNRAKSNKNDFADVNSYEIELMAEEYGIELE